MIQTYEDAIEAVAKRTYRNKQNIDQSDRQRRYSFVDLYGVEYHSTGDDQNPATIYIGISKDMEYINRFEFKLMITPFETYVATGGVQAATVEVKDKSLTTNGSTITPNPHSHGTEPHTHNLVSGKTLTPVTANTFRLYMDGIDLTPYLMAQGTWVNGEGVFPSVGIGRDYDILEVGSDMEAEGNTANRAKITSAGNHKIEITANGPFSVTLLNYLKYSNMNR